MASRFDQPLGVAEPALQLRARRHELLASNIANADTPGYKARDMDFREAMRQATGPSPEPLRATHAQHLQPDSPSLAAGDPQALYRVPHSPSLDGNTVETHVEKAKFAENVVDYQATIEFLKSRVQKLSGAIKGK
ncbi:flagellar basal body rod protein FlgB [Halorhodospira neutriphila]|uniref:Flagellar basal body rod protein FlgB n=1 Tax=Halorhodospira neutriphila TaxID=168379 RepID=A0ABS1E886_9GAMM|nr:flagellar basal body rod protein FlgB [Halorhodospira neutriphila]MBK1726925.1 flagellar basal body rod protein FlgB [Halorhodospira neutriphila]